MDITREIATKVRDTVDAGLVSGLGWPIAGQMCVEAAVSFALGLPHGDDPACVSPALRRLNTGLNDPQWSSATTRAAGLRRLALAQLGSAGVLDEKEFVRRLVEMTIRRAVPQGLRAAASVNQKHAKELEAAAVWCEQEGTRESARNGERVAKASASASADAAAASAASAYASASAASASAASYAAASYASSVDAAADAAAYAADAADDASARARDRALAEYSEWVVEILIAMNAPGVQWLDLVPKEAAA